MRAVVGLDIGTTSVKAVAMTDATSVIASASSSPLALTAAEPGQALQSTAELRAAVVECLVALVAEMGPEIECVALCAGVQSGSLVTIDDRGLVGAQMTTWMDTRTVGIIDEWQGDGTATTIRRLSGWSAQPGLGLAQIAWLRTNDPEAWSRVARVGSADDYVTALLTGAWTTNPSSAAGMQLLEIATGSWSAALCELAGLEIGQLSELRPSGGRIGHLTDEMATATGLSAGLDVVNGGHDQTCTALALGVDKPGEALLAGGTAWVLTAVVADDDVDAVPDEMSVSFHVVDGLRTTSRYLGGLGASMEWWLSEAGFDTGGSRYATLDRELDSAEITRDSPYFLPMNDADTVGVGQPGAGQFWPDDSPTDRGTRARAIMEFAAFEVRSALAALPTSHRPQRLTLVGGATEAPGWAQLIADGCSIPVTVAPARPWPAVGAALLAGRAVELFDHEGPPVATASRGPLLPRADASALLDHRYRTHLDLSQEKRR